MNDSISSIIRLSILNQLQDLEQRRDIRILFAAESGSRMWGFPSVNSDYDVRFIYVSHPRWYAERHLYLKADLNGRDTIDHQVVVNIDGRDEDLDFHGWDLVKALDLLKASNPSLNEWLASHLIYRSADTWMEPLRKVAATRWSAQAAHGHYRSMVVRNFKEYLRSENVRYKKYLYTLRPILCADYVLDHLKPPPMLFSDLLAQSLMGPPVRSAIEDLLQWKASGKEQDTMPRNDVLNKYIEAAINSQAHDALDMSREGQWPNAQQESNNDLIQLVRSGLKLYGAEYVETV